MKITTWNLMHRSTGVLDYITNEIKSDISIVQEAVDPSKNFDINRFVWTSIADGRNWGSGILSTGLNLKQVVFNKNAHPGSLIGALAELPNGKKIYFFSLYAILDKYPYTKSRPGESTTTIHRMLSDLEFLLKRAHTEKAYVVLGGDFNNHPTHFYEKYGTKDFCTKADKLVFERVEDFGMIECVKKSYPNQNIPTYKNVQIDYMYISKNLDDSAVRLVKTEVLDNEKVRSLSDHNPIVITLDGI